MDIHKPKPVHGLREFLGEIGVIVCGVLIAIALEQTVESLHHHAQAREMLRKLREESIENRDVVAYDFDQSRLGIAAADRQIAIVSDALQHGRLPEAAGITPMPPRGTYSPGDSAWITIRDSALLPIMPQHTIGNYWKIDTTLANMNQRSGELSVGRRRLQALIETAHERPMDAALAHDLLVALNGYREDELSFSNFLESFRIANEAELAGKVLAIKDRQTARAAH